MQQKQDLFSVTDSLNIDEYAFLSQIAKENEFILLSKQATRYYQSNDSKDLLYTELVYTREQLQEDGYVSMNLKFIGPIARVTISYDFNLGQASIGYGSVAGNGTSDYVHSFNSCGLTSCMVLLFKNKQKILEKKILHKQQ